MKTKTAPIEWALTSESLDGVTLQAGPVSRLIPDGCRVVVNVWTEERTYHDHARPVGERHVVEPFRVASVSLCDAEGMRSKEGASVRFAGTVASGSCYAKCEERMGYVDGPDEPRRLYWWASQTTAWRLDGFALDLPEGAVQAMRDVFTSASEYIGEHLPHLWAGAEVKRARRRLDDAESSLKAIREEVKDARADLRQAERRHGKATA